MTLARASRILLPFAAMLIVAWSFFDVANRFRGCIAGCHEVLRRQGLLESIACLDPDEGLSDGQARELDRIAADYPHLNDDAFVAEHRARWLD